MEPIPTILVCGGRDYDDRDKVYNTLYQVCEDRGWNSEPDQYGNTLPRVRIIHGGAKGADSIADDFAVVNWCVLSVYPANWRKYPKAAGCIRNQQMLDEGQPDLVVAFPGGNGTADMVKRAKKAGIEVIEVEG
jgi:hypothetical protein